MADAPGVAPAVVPIRPMGFREILDTPFAVIQLRARLFGAATLLAVALGEALVVLVLLVVGAAPQTTATLWWTAAVTTGITAFAMRLLLAAFATAAAMATVRSETVTSRTAWQAVSDALPAIAMLQVRQLLLGVSVLALSTLCITLPLGLVLLVRLRSQRFIALPALVAERTNATAAVQRSKTLTAGAGWPMASVWLALGGVLLLCVVPLMGVPMTALGLLGPTRWTALILVTLTVLLFAAAATIVESATRAVSYVDRRCRREGVDIPVPVSR